MNKSKTYTLDASIDKTHDVIISIESMYEDIVYNGNVNGDTIISLTNGGTAINQAEENAVKSTTPNTFVYRYKGGSTSANEYLLTDYNGKYIKASTYINSMKYAINYSELENISKYYKITSDKRYDDYGRTQNNTGNIVKLENVPNYIEVYAKYERGNIFSRSGEDGSYTYTLDNNGGYLKVVEAGETNYYEIAQYERYTSNYKSYSALNSSGEQADRQWGYDIETNGIYTQSTYGEYIKVGNRYHRIIKCTKYTRSGTDGSYVYTLDNEGDYVYINGDVINEPQDYGSLYTISDTAPVTDFKCTGYYKVESTARKYYRYVTLQNGIEKDVDFMTSNSNAERNNYITVAVYKESISYIDLTSNSKFYDKLENEEYIENNNLNNILKIYFETGQIEFFVRIVPPIEGEDNITVEFNPVKGDNYDILRNCNISAVFGTAGNDDRLFLSGNSNTIYYSASVDFSYFPFDNYVDIGNTSNSIVALTRLNDSTLAVHKEVSHNDATIYYITASYVTIGDREVIKFSPIAGTIGETPINHHTNFNLAGDNLFLSENGVYGLKFSENIKSTERYALERSAFVNSRLTKHKDLSKARAIVYKNRYYLAIDDVVYIADARFKSSARDEDMNDTFNYEWWYWENVPVKKWVIDGNDLCFISSKTNNLNVFYDGFVDEEQYTLSLGNVTAYDGEWIQVNSAFCKYLKKGNKIKIGASEYIMSEVDEYNSRIKITNSDGTIIPTSSLDFQTTWYIVDLKNVVSVWQTPICSLGTTIYSKNLLSNTLVFEPNIEGKIRYAYRTSNKNNDYESMLRPGGLDFDNIDFTEFSLDSNFARSRTIKSRVRNFCFIDFIFESNDNRDCALNNFTITYNIGRKNKGVR